MSHPSALATGASTTYETVKDSYVPVFSNRPADYREWRQRINLYYKKMVLQKRPQEDTINLVTTLTGVAWKQIEYDADKLCEDDQGFAQILDKFFYNNRVEQPRSFEKFFYQVSRRPGQTLMSYCSEHREHQREVENHGIKLPDKIAGWLLLRRAGLSQKQRQLVLSQTSSTLAEEKVEQALYYLFGQDYRGKISSPEGYGKGDRHRSFPHRWQKRGQAYAADDEEYYEDDELFLAEDEDETAHYEEQAHYDAADYADVEDDETAYNAQRPMRPTTTCRSTMILSWKKPTQHTLTLEDVFLNWRRTGISILWLRLVLNSKAMVPSRHHIDLQHVARARAKAREPHLLKKVMQRAEARQPSARWISSNLGYVLSAINLDTLQPIALRSGVPRRQLPLQQRSSDPHRSWWCKSWFLASFDQHLRLLVSSHSKMVGQVAWFVVMMFWCTMSSIFLTEVFPGSILSFGPSSRL